MTDIKRRIITKQELYRHLFAYTNVTYINKRYIKKLIDAEQIVNYKQLAEYIGA